MNADTALLVLIFADGERVTREIQLDKTRGRGRLDAGLHAVGKEFAPTSEYWAGSVLIHGTDIYQYGAGETREVLGQA